MQTNLKFDLAMRISGSTYEDVEFNTYPRNNYFSLTQGKNVRVIHKIRLIKLTNGVLV